MWKLPWWPFDDDEKAEVTVEQLMHATGSSLLVQQVTSGTGDEKKDVDLRPAKLSMTGLKVGQVQFLASRFERHDNIRI